MSVRCWFAQCDWIFHMNVLMETAPCGDGHAHAQAGLYQCTRCKDISLGSARDNQWLTRQNEPKPGFWEKVWNRG